LGRDYWRNARKGRFIRWLAISLAFAAGAFALSALCVAGLRSWAAVRMLDIPNARSSHTRPTPRGGGLGVVVAVLIGVWSLHIFRILSVPLREITALSIAGGLVALKGGFDDIYRVPYNVRLVGQAISAAIILFAVAYIHTMTIPFAGDIHLHPIGIPLSFLWIMGLTNVYNFMDGIDGIAGGQALIAGSGWVVMGFMSGQPTIGLVGVLLAASSLGFLLHNWPPARIFMGDVGSAFIGFTLAVLPIFAGRKDPRFIVVGFLVVWPFIFDSSFTVARRLIKNENIFTAHRSHIYQRLVLAGYRHRSVTLVYMGLAVIGTVIALLWLERVPSADVLVILLPILLFAGLWRFTVRAEARAKSAKT